MKLIMRRNRSPFAAALSLLAMLAFTITAGCGDTSSTTSGTTTTTVSASSTTTTATTATTGTTATTSTTATTATTTTTTVATKPVSGSVTAGPVDGGTLTVLDASGSTVAGPVSVTGGHFTVNVPESRLSEDLTFQSSGGSFTDEATSQSTAAGELAAVAAGGSMASADVNLTPATTVIKHLVKKGKTLAAAKTAFANAFGYTPDSAVKPEFASGTGVTDAQMMEGMSATAFSKLTKDMGLAPGKQFELLAKLADDLDDSTGELDGTGSSGAVMVDGTAMPEDIAGRMEDAMIAAKDGMGMTVDKIGKLPFAKVRFTSKYRIKYMPGMGMMSSPTNGKATFKLQVKSRTSNLPVSGLTLGLTPIMHMATKNHGTPVDSIVDNSDGTYTCTLYYLMASMGSGGAMQGFWELTVTADSESVKFHPVVGMAMGTDTVRATLKDANDKIAGGMGGSVRSYYLFKNSLSGMTNSHAFKLFIATTNDMMTDYPAVSVGTTLKDQNSANWTVTTMTVDASTDGGTTWLPMTDKGGGHWEISGMTGLTSGVAGTITVRMSINGTAKTSDGTSGGTAASFTVSSAP